MNIYRTESRDLPFANTLRFAENYVISKVNPSKIKKNLITNLYPCGYIRNLGQRKIQHQSKTLYMHASE